MILSTFHNQLSIELLIPIDFSSFKNIIHVIPQAYQTVFVRSQHARYKYSNFLANRYCKYLRFLKSAFTAVYLQ